MNDENLQPIVTQGGVIKKRLWTKCGVIFYIFVVFVTSVFEGAKNLCH